MTVCADCAEHEHYLCDGGCWDADSGDPAICGCWADGHDEWSGA